MMVTNNRMLEHTKYHNGEIKKDIENRSIHIHGTRPVLTVWGLHLLL